MRDNIINGLKLSVLLLAMTTGFWFIYVFVWYAVGLPLTNLALWLILAVAGLTEYGYFRWIRE